MSKYGFWKKKYDNAGPGADSPATEFESQYTRGGTVRQVETEFGTRRIAAGGAWHRPNHGVILVFRPGQDEVPLKLFRQL